PSLPDALPISELQAALGLAVDRDRALSSGRGGPPARLRLDQAADRLAAVPHDMGRTSNSSGHELEVYDHEAQVLAFEAGFDQHAVADVTGNGDRLLDSIKTVQSDRDSPPLLSPGGLHHDPSMLRDKRRERRVIVDSRHLRRSGETGPLDNPAGDCLVVADGHGNTRRQFRETFTALDGAST